MSGKVERTRPSVEAQLRSIIAGLSPKNQQVFRSVRVAMRKRFPTANELAYDYGHSLVIGYSPTDKGIDAVVAISAREASVFLYFSQGPKLPDPKGLLLGKGKQTRFIRIDSASRLAEPEVKAFIAATIDQATIPLPAAGKGTLIIKKSRAAKEPSRKKTAKR